jgi:hypothetical protein
LTKRVIGADKYQLCLDLLFVKYKEHHSYLCLYQPEKSAVAEYSISMVCCSNYSGMYRYLGGLVKEAV